MQAQALEIDAGQRDHTVEVVECENNPGAWTAEAIGADGEIYQAIFIGPHARRRAEEYASFKYSQES